MPKFVVILKCVTYKGVIIEAETAEEAESRYDYNRAAYKMFDTNQCRICDKPDKIVMTVAQENMDGLEERLP